MTDATGSVSTTYTYEPFGATSTFGAVTGNSLDFTGREDDGTGLKYYRVRYYHSGLQRFISEDPIGFGGGDTNLYAYVWNGPSNVRDPLGEWGFGLSGGASAGAGLGAGAVGSVSGGVGVFGGDGLNAGAFGTAGGVAGLGPYGLGIPIHPDHETGRLVSKETGLVVTLPPL